MTTENAAALNISVYGSDTITDAHGNAITSSHWDVTCLGQSWAAPDWYTDCAEGWAVLVCAEAEVEWDEWEAIADQLVAIDNYRCYPITPTREIGYALHCAQAKIGSPESWETVLVSLGSKLDYDQVAVNEASIQTTSVLPSWTNQALFEAARRLVDDCEWLSACEITVPDPTMVWTVQAIFYRKDKRDEITRMIKNA